MTDGLIRKTKKGVSEYVKCYHAHAQAITTLLRHYSPEWRKEEDEADDEELPQNVKKGIPVSHWIDAEMTGDWEELDNIDETNHKSISDYETD